MDISSILVTRSTALFTLVTNEGNKLGLHTATRILMEKLYDVGCTIDLDIDGKSAQSKVNKFT